MESVQTGVRTDQSAVTPIDRVFAARLANRRIEQDRARAFSRSLGPRRRRREQR
jgi:hypothetical protein